MSAFKDHFSGHAALYRAHRPLYPSALFEWLVTLPQRHEHAWDCATGNGQAAMALAARFQQVTATDASAEQIAQTENCANIHYRQATAEDSRLPPGSIDLITVAQAAHWFDLPAFMTEATRVLRPGGVLALWCYGLTRITPSIDQIVDHYYDQVVGAYWPPERRHIENGYQDFVMPFEEIPAPPFQMQATWTLAQLVGYLNSWSATQRCIAETDSDVITDLTQALQAAWGDEERYLVSWPLSLRIGRHYPD